MAETSGVGSATPLSHRSMEDPVMGVVAASLAISSVSRSSPLRVVSMPRHRAHPCAHQSLPPSLTHPDPGVPAERSSVGNGLQLPKEGFRVSGDHARATISPYNLRSALQRSDHGIRPAKGRPRHCISLSSLESRRLGFRTIDVAPAICARRGCHKKSAFPARERSSPPARSASWPLLTRVLGPRRRGPGTGRA